MRKISKKNMEIGLITLVLTLIGYILYLFSLSMYHTGSEYSYIIFINSWLGIFLGIYILTTWKKVTGLYFTLYTIFMLYFFLFNYGQPLMWAFGIHNSSEILNKPLFFRLGIPNQIDIIRAQNFTLISILMFHLGALLCYKGNNNLDLDKENEKIEDRKTLKSLHLVSSIIGLVSIPITMYYSIYNVIVSKIYGYKALYYSDFANIPPIIDIFDRLFFPCIVGMLIGSKYNEKTKRYLYVVFTIYVILQTMSGNRGGWIYKLIILLWMSHTFYQPLNFKGIFRIALTSFVGLFILDAVVSVRATGVTIDSLRNAINFNELPIISTIFEMGGSMKPLIVLQKYGWDIWPYSNTYLLAFLGMISNKFIYLFGLEFSLISSWFSQTYLNISYGAGFSIIAEALLNFGPIYAPLFMAFMGYIISSLIYVDKNINYKRKPLKMFFAIASLHAMIFLIRNFLHLQLKTWFITVFLVCMLVVIIRESSFKK